MNGKQHFAIGTIIGVSTCMYLTYNQVQIGNLDFIKNIPNTYGALDNIKDKFEFIKLCITGGDVFNPLFKTAKSLGLYVSQTVLPTFIGSMIGSWLPDIDSKKSKAAQIFNKLLLIALSLFGLMIFTKNDMVKGFLEQGRSSLNNNFWLLIFIGLTVMGYLSSHRKFTHRWFGTALFALVSFRLFSYNVFFGFMVGYLLHIGADRTTPDGRNLKFFKFTLPMTNSKGKFKLSI